MIRTLKLGLVIALIGLSSSYYVSADGSTPSSTIISTTTPTPTMNDNTNNEPHLELLSEEPKSFDTDDEALVQHIESSIPHLPTNLISASELLSHDSRFPEFTIGSHRKMKRQNIHKLWVVGKEKKAADLADENEALLKKDHITNQAEATIDDALDADDYNEAAAPHTVHKPINKIQHKMQKKKHQNRNKSHQNRVHVEVHVQ